MTSSSTALDTPSREAESLRLEDGSRIAVIGSNCLQFKPNNQVGIRLGF